MSGGSYLFDDEFAVRERGIAGVFEDEAELVDHLCHPK
jgi:hypothetical protein